jgi:hypothetical protein
MASRWGVSVIRLGPLAIRPNASVVSVSIAVFRRSDGQERGRVVAKPL